VKKTHPGAVFKHEQFQDIAISRMVLHFSAGARIRATTDDYIHETHEKTRNTILIFV